MKQDALEQVAETAKSRRKGKNWQRIVAGFAAAVTIFSCVQVFPAAAAEQAWYCGYEEHQHGADCYEKRKICGYEDEPEGEIHVHTDQCYRKRICNLEEGGHVHTENCISTEETVACNITEPGHVHDGACMEMRQSYICGKEENGHIHVEGCYETADKPQCGLLEGHVHGEECWENVLICGKEEHIHSLQCESDPQADVENEQMWADSAEKLDLSGNWREDVLKVAQGELGYEESKRNFLVDSEGIAAGYTRYGAWYGDPYGDWNGMFVSFCLHYAGIPETEMPYGADCAQWVEELSEKSLFFGKERGPKKGDLIFFDTNSDGIADRMGIIVEPELAGEGENLIRVLEGDSNGRVEYVNHEAGESGILGFAELPENPDLKEPPTETTVASDPTETTAASDPTETTAASDPTETTAASDPTETTEASEPAETTEASEPAESTEASNPTEAVDKPMLMTAVNGAEARSTTTVSDLTIEVGTQLSVPVGQGETVKIPFTPEYTHQYIFESKSNQDTYGYLYNESGSTITSDNDSGTNRNFKITYTLTAETNYYLGVKFQSSSHAAGTIPVLLSLGTQHTYVKNESGDRVCGCGIVAPTSGADWIYENGVLTIRGNGAMADYASADQAPWAPYQPDIQRIVVDAGVTKIGSYAFPGCANATEVSLPDSLTSIGSHAFSDCAGLTSVTIPGSVTSMGSYAFYNCSGLTGDIVIPDGVTAISDYTFYGCKNLTGVTLPDGITSIGIAAFYDCSSLTSFRIPGKTTSVGGSVFSLCSRLNTLYWDAEEKVGLGYSNTTGAKFKVIVRKQAGSFTNSNLKQLVEMGCYAVEFEKPNYISLTALQGRNLTPPLTHLQDARYYIDGQGVFYRIDGDEAYVAFCQPGLDSCTIPGTIPGEDGTPLTVVGVGLYAFNQATVRTLDFEAPENIKTLENFSFYHAVNLESINGANTEETVLAMFTSLESQGTLPFQYTKIEAEDAYTLDPVVIEAGEGDGLKVTMQTVPGKDRKPDQDAANKTFLYYTGNQAETIVSISNPADSSAGDGTVVRIYYHFSADGGQLNYKPGEEYELRTDYSSYKLNVYETDLPNCYCLEMERPVPGDTVSITMNSYYPSPESGGGSASVWCSVLTEEEQKTCFPTDLAPITKSHLLRWDTVKDKFPIKKTSGMPTMVGDGKGHATTSNLIYGISIPREGTTLQGMGKDYMTRVEYRDVLTLGEGVTLSDTVVQAVQDKNYTVESGYECKEIYVYTPQKTHILRMSSDDYDLEGVSLAIEDGKLVTRWRVSNNNLSTEIPDVPVTLEFDRNVVMVMAPQSGETYSITNDVYDTQHFMHSEDVEGHADCRVEFSTTEGYLRFEKKYTGSQYGTHYLGEKAPFRIVVENPAVLPYDGLATIEDKMTLGYYLTPEQMVSLFVDPQTSRIQITRARLCDPASAGKDVTGMDGTSHGTTSVQNTGTGTAYAGLAKTDSCYEKYNVTITVTRAADGLQIQFTHGGTTETETCDGTAAGIQEVLDKHGFVVTYDTEYRIVWSNTDKDGNPIPLVGGQNISKSFTATSKDTFMRLSEDRKYRYSSSSSNGSNWANAYDQHRNTIGQGYASSEHESEFFLTKGYAKDGKSIDNDTELNEGDVLDYTLNVEHYGPGRYDLLPLVDHMTGGQALLVPKAPNETEAWAGSATMVTVDGAEYYRLDKEDVYSRVWTTAGQMADSVTVTKKDTGLDTLIKWYFTNYSGKRTDKVTYQSMLCPSVAVPGKVSYDLNNETWLNDHQSHRLYNDVPGKHALLLDFDKKIVENVGDTGPGTTYCPVAKGQTVTYRLTLEGKVIKDDVTEPMILKGTDLYDALPFSINSYWKKGVNVELTYGAGGTVKNGEKWYITTGTSQQLRWEADFEIAFTDKAYIYVTLTFPDDTETDKQWEAYAHRYSTTTLYNTFHVLTNQKSVSHSVSIEGKSRLQKGVYSSHGQSANMVNQKDARYYYSNRGYNNFIVTYYISVYNGGKNPLYLTDIQDRLPKGFTLKTRSGNTAYKDGADVYKADGTKAEHRIAEMTQSVVKTEDGTQWVKFHFIYPEQKYWNAERVHYSKEWDMCYLEPGEAIAFTYECYTNGAEGTEDVAVNVAAMPYFDYTSAGVKVDEDSKSKVHNSTVYTPNDGGCDVKDSKWASDNGFTGTEKNWLSSEVAVTRGGIKPGITKELTSRKDINGNIHGGSNSANPTDILNWTIKAENDGTSRMVDYILTDEIQAPYGFIGTVSYRTYDYSNNAQYAQELFTIERTDDPNALEIRYWHYNANGSGSRRHFTLTFGNKPKEMYVNGEHNSHYALYLSIVQNAKGNYVMSLRFTGTQPAIPAGGRGELTVSTENYEHTAENKQFLNQCFITPMAQTWEGGTNKGNVVSLKTPFADKEMKTVRNSAPVTTAFGFVTESLKSIWEVGNESNKAASDENRNYIILENRDKLFRYSAAIRNDTEEAMTQLILIDSLPELNDHGVFAEDDFRYSQFKVSLAQDPDFAVIVTESGNPDNTKILDKSQYTLEFSKATSFNANDWNGTSDWSSDPTGARSIRLKIEDNTKTVIPAGYVVDLQFTCKIDGSAEPGTIAWNSFGYHYRLGSPVTLEAAPLKVGVKIPTMPKLSKRLVDHQGAEIAAVKDETFSFLVYEGEALTGSFETLEELTDALTGAGRKFQDFTVTVPKGKSVSEAIPMTGSNGWAWVNGQKYTIAELPTGEDYAFRAFTGAGGNVTYNNDQEMTIVGENTSLRWSVALTKTDPEGAVLKGAVFGLYSPGETDFEIPADYEKYNAAPEVQFDGGTWYLAGLGTTGRDGTLRFDDLLGERYYLLEVQAPDGHILNKEGKLLERKNESQGVCPATVVNNIDYELPESGGPGTFGYTAAGLLLTAGAWLLLLRKKRGFWA